MTNLCSDVLNALLGKSLVTAESCTGGGIGAALTAVPGSSKVYKGGVISYTNWVKENVLGVDRAVLEEYGAVSPQVAALMASGVKERLKADVAVSVTGLAGPDSDGTDRKIGTVFIGYCSDEESLVQEFCFSGDRDLVRQKAVKAALELVLRMALEGMHEED